MNYQDCPVLVTGGLGFIGLNLVGALLDCGAKVTILNRSVDPLAYQWLQQIAAGRPLTFYQDDLRTTTRLNDWLHKGEIIFNLAGKSGAARSLIDAHADMQGNVEGHLHLLEMIRHCTRFPRVVFVSSRLVYGKTGQAPVTENAPTLPTSIYGLHKLTVEHYHRLYHQYYDLPFTVLRLTNPYGAYQHPARHDYGVINYFMIQLLQGKPITIYGDGQQLRDYIYIGDVVQALLLAGKHPAAPGQVFNVGYGQSLSLETMVEMLIAAAQEGSYHKIPFPALEKYVETGDFRCDIHAIQSILGWQPTTSHQDGVRETLALYRKLLA